MTGSAMPTAVFAALGDPVRGAIVDRLSEGEATVGELAALFPITFQAVSQQVRSLERAGVVARRREGRTQRVRLRREPIDEAVLWMDARRQRLEQQYRRLDTVLEQLLDEGPDPRPGPNPAVSTEI